MWLCGVDSDLTGLRVPQANPEAWGNATSFVVANGPANKSEDEISYRKATAFQMRLFEYELPGETYAQLVRLRAAVAEPAIASADTIMLMTPTEVHVVTTAKKGSEKNADAACCRRFASALHIHTCKLKPCPLLWSETVEFLKPVAEPWKAQCGVTLKARAHASVSIQHGSDGPSTTSARESSRERRRCLVSPFGRSVPLQMRAHAATHTAMRTIDVGALPDRAAGQTGPGEKPLSGIPRKLDEAQGRSAGALQSTRLSASEIFNCVRISPDRRSVSFAALCSRRTRSPRAATARSRFSLSSPRQRRPAHRSVTSPRRHARASAAAAAAPLLSAPSPSSKPADVHVSVM